MSKEDNNYIVFAEDSTAMMQESLIQQSNPLTKERAIEFAERIKDRDYLFCVTILKRVSKEELNQNKEDENEEIIGKEFNLDLGSLSPVSMIVRDITDDKVIVEYLHSTPGRIEEFSISDFEYLANIQLNQMKDE